MSLPTAPVVGEPVATSFADVLDAAESLDADAQAELVAVPSRRLAERGRDCIAESIRAARAEFDAGGCRPMSAADMIREAY